MTNAAKNPMAETLRYYFNSDRRYFIHNADKARKMKKMIRRMNRRFHKNEVGNEFSMMLDSTAMPTDSGDEFVELTVNESLTASVFALATHNFDNAPDNNSKSDAALVLLIASLGNVNRNLQTLQRKLQR